MKQKLSLILLSVILLTGCTSRLTDFTVISTKNYPIDYSGVEVTKENMRIKGEDTGHFVFCIPVSNPNLKEAIDKAIESYPGCIGLADGVVKHKMWWAYLYGQQKYIVEGTPIVAKKTAAKRDVNEPVFDVNEGLIFTHEVKSNETLGTIAQMYNVSVGNIIKWNGLTTSNVTPGMKIKVIVK